MTSLPDLQVTISTCLAMIIINIQYQSVPMHPESTHVNKQMASLMGKPILLLSNYWTYLDNVYMKQAEIDMHKHTE